MKTWVRQQGRGASRHQRRRSASWWCGACGKWHSPSVARVRTLTGNTICFQKFASGEYDGPGSRTPAE